MKRELMTELKRCVVISSLCVTSAVVGCTDVELISAPVSVTINGQYCTDDSHNFEVPIRILLVIDTSASMELNDPLGYRAKAAADLVSHMTGQAEDVAFAFIAFNTAATALTDGFVKDLAVIQQALNGLGVSDGFTNYLAALDLAKTIILKDLEEVRDRLQELEAAGEDTRYARPWYFVVFLSDGIPRMPDGSTQDSQTILWEVEDLMDLPDEAMGITLHTAFLGAATDTQRPEAEALLGKIARDGQGSYFSFESGDEIDFRMFEFEIKRIFLSKFFMAYNPFAHLSGGAILADSDADGLADIDEEELGTDPTNPDTDGDHMRDGFEAKSALDPLVADPHCEGDARADSDHDGLLDCEEDFLNFCPNRFDCDGDLFPDGVEFWSGSNPGDASDILFDPDFDGILTRDELVRRTNPLEDDIEIHERYAYRYTTERLWNSDSGVTCYDYRVRNVKLLNTSTTVGREDGYNEIYLYYIESPKDDAENVFSLKRLIIPLNRWEYRRQDRDVQIDTNAEFEQIATQEARND
ncbi:VWA domain-containing protein [Myxococcota bacterium]